MRGKREKGKGKRENLFTHCSLLITHHFILFTLYFLLSTALAVTYQTDASGGPETLATEVTEGFEAWKALDDKLEVSSVEENPESLFQYGTPERFSPDTLSITVQRQQESRQLIHFISPNAENRKRILLHEVGIAIGLTPQTELSLSTPAQPTSEPLPETPTDTSEPVAENPDSTQEGTTDNTTQTESTTSPEPTEESTENTEATENTDTTQEESTDTTTSEGTQEESQEPTDSTTTEDTQEDTSTSDSSTETSQDATTQGTTETGDVTPSETTPEAPATTIKAWETVMNPSINADDKTELGEGEKELLKLLNLFAKEDINKDGNINFYDLVAISQAFGQRNVNDSSDINKDGLVNQADVDLLRKAYTFSDPSTTAPGQSTPENPEGQTGPELPEGEPPTDTNTDNE